MTICFDDSLHREIWQTVRAMNATWTKGDPSELVNYFHRDMVAVTATDRYRREGGAACIAGWKGFAEAAAIYHWEEIDPCIRVYGDAAVVTYYFEIAYAMNGRTIEMRGRNMFFLIRENGRWWAVADQYSPYPA